MYYLPDKEKKGQDMQCHQLDAKIDIIILFVFKGLDFWKVCVVCLMFKLSLKSSVFQLLLITGVIPY